MSILKRIKAARGYLRYRVATEVQYLRQFSGAFQYLERTYNWWRYNFPEYVLPSSLPDPPGSPPTPPPWTLVPFAALLQRIPIWEMQLDNLLLFGHTMPTNAEVDFRKSYLEWADDFKRGVYRPLPVDAIVREARTTRVPVYEHPFVHEELWAFAAARARHAACRALPMLRLSEPLELPPWPAHWRNFVTVHDEHGRVGVVRPAQLLLPTVAAVQDGPGTGSDTSAPAAPGGAPHAGGEDLRAAAQDMRAAAEDAWSVVGTVRTSFAALSPTILAFLRDRVDTLRTALAEFMQGYTEGVREVESGQVDVAQDARQFYDKMLHTLPDALSAIDTQLQRPRGPSLQAEVPSARPQGQEAGMPAEAGGRSEHGGSLVSSGEVQQEGGAGRSGRQ